MRHETLIRAGNALGLALLVAASLLAFPVHTPWMVLVWIGWCSARVVRGKRTWPCLLGCVAILLLKRIPFAWSSTLVIATMLAAAVVDAVRSSEQYARRRKRLVVLSMVMGWIACAIMGVDWHLAARCGREVALNPTRPIVCLGNSLTSGIAPYGGYPDDLAKLLRVPIRNMGRPGITSGDALSDLPNVIATNPQAVIVELGGHDFLKGDTRASTEANLERIVDACRAVEAEVILIEIPRGFVVDPYAGIERCVARRWDLELIPDTSIRKLVLWSPHAPPGMWTSKQCHYSDDGLHPNRRGNQLLARVAAEALERVFGPEVRSSSARP